MRRLQAGGDAVLTERTGSAQDSAMNATAQERFSNQSDRSFNAMNTAGGTNCDQFVKQVFGQGDPGKPSQMSGIWPKQDAVELLFHGLPSMDPTNMPGQNPNAPQSGSEPPHSKTL